MKINFLLFMSPFIFDLTNGFFKNHNTKSNIIKLNFNRRSYNFSERYLELLVKKNTNMNNTNEEKNKYYEHLLKNLNSKNSTIQNQYILNENNNENENNIERPKIKIILTKNSNFFEGLGIKFNPQDENEEGGEEEGGGEGEDSSVKIVRCVILNACARTFIADQMTVEFA